MFLCTINCGRKVQGGTSLLSCQSVESDVTRLHAHWTEARQDRYKVPTLRACRLSSKLVGRCWRPSRRRIPPPGRRQYIHAIAFSFITFPWSSLGRSTRVGKSWRWTLPPLPRSRQGHPSSCSSCRARWQETRRSGRTSAPTASDSCLPCWLRRPRRAELRPRQTPSVDSL